MEALGAHGIDEWSAVCSRSFVPLLADADGSFRGVVRHLSVHDIGVSFVESTPSRVYRPSHLIKREPRDDVLLSIHLTGAGRVAQAGRSARLTPGEGALYEADRAYELTFPTPMSEIVLQVPRYRLRLRDSVLRDATARRLTGGPNLIVLRHFLSGVLAAGDASEEALHGLAEVASDLLSAALSPFVGTDEKALSGDALWHAVRSELRRRSSDPTLTVESLARGHGVSRRHLEIVFARHGTSPAACLRDQRLERARALLHNSSATVTSIAYASGFSDVNTFIRAFRRAHGRTPQDWRRQQTSDRAASPSPRT